MRFEPCVLHMNDERVFVFSFADREREVNDAGSEVYEFGSGESANPSKSNSEVMGMLLQR